MNDVQGFDGVLALDDARDAVPSSARAPEGVQRNSLDLRGPLRDHLNVDVAFGKCAASGKV